MARGKSSPKPRLMSGSRRHRILDYVAAQGGELRSSTGQGLRRQIAEALGERPTVVSQTLIALERAGLIERELDVDRHRCFAIRLTEDASSVTGVPHDAVPDGAGGADALPDAETLMVELKTAQVELKEAILEASRISRRVRDLSWALMRTEASVPVTQD